MPHPRARTTRTVPNMRVSVQVKRACEEPAAPLYIPATRGMCSPSSSYASNSSRSSNPTDVTDSPPKEPGTTWKTIGAPSVGFCLSSLGHSRDTKKADNSKLRGSILPSNLYEPDLCSVVTKSSMDYSNNKQRMKRRTSSESNLQQLDSSEIQEQDEEAEIEALGIENNRQQQQQKQRDAKILLSNLNNKLHERQQEQQEQQQQDKKEQGKSRSETSDQSAKAQEEQDQMLMLIAMGICDSQASLSLDDNDNDYDNAEKKCSTNCSTRSFGTLKTATGSSTWSLDYIDSCNFKGECDDLDFSNNEIVGHQKQVKKVTEFEQEEAAAKGQQQHNNNNNCYYDNDEDIDAELFRVLELSKRQSQQRMQTIHYDACHNCNASSNYGSCTNQTTTTSTTTGEDHDINNDEEFLRILELSKRKSQQYMFKS